MGAVGTAGAADAGGAIAGAPGVEDPEKLKQYLSGAGGTVPAHNGKVLAYTESPEVIEGETDRPRIVLIEFPDMDAAKAWYNSPDYQAVVGFRLESVTGTLLMFPGMG